MSKLTDEQKERYKLKAREKRAKLRKHTESDVICRLCNLVVNAKGMPVHLQNVHVVNFDTYVIEHLEDFKQFGWGNCETCGKVTKGTTCSRKCMAKWRSKNFSGENHPWWNKKHSKKSKEKISKTNTQYHIDNIHPFLGKTHSNETKKKISQTRIDRGVAKGDRNPMFGKTHTETALRKIFDKRSMTTPELILKNILDELKIDYHAQFFINTNGTVYSYDFYLPNYRLIIEVDGDYWHGGPGVQKHWYGVNETVQTDIKKDTIAIDRGYRILRLWESQLKQNKKLIIDILQRKLHT
jgi:very-short-patch-repair endonuclease